MKPYLESNSIIDWKILQLLTTSNTYQDVFKHLPDTALIKPVSSIKVAG